MALSRDTMVVSGYNLMYTLQVVLMAMLYVCTLCVYRLDRVVFFKDLLIGVQHLFLT